MALAISRIRTARAVAAHQNQMVLAHGGRRLGIHLQSENDGVLIVDSGGTVGKPDEGAESLVLARDLFESLNGRGIRYCHWKSNCNLDRALRGLTDLDLLVDRGHALCFREVLLGHGFKPALSPRHAQYPAMEDYLGYDQPSGHLTHLHVHYQLILGEQFIKNYHLPLEQTFLDGDHNYLGVRLPLPELETIVLVIRTLLKLRDRDIFKSIFSPRRFGLTVATGEEFKYLLSQTTPGSISRVLESQVDLVSQDIVLGFLHMIEAGHMPRAALYRLRRRLRRELVPFQRYSRWQAFARYVRPGLLPKGRFLPKRFSTREKKRLVSGGMTIAVVGADGSGKSTVVSALHKWLSWRLNVDTHYMGSKQPSLLTGLVGWGSRAIAYAYRALCALIGEEHARSLVGLPRLFQSLHLLAIGKDRYRRYLAGQKSAAQGNLVLFDRYPLPAIRMGERYMDGPRIASSYAGQMGPVIAALSRAETTVYQHVRPPDHLVMLHVSPEVSSQRKPGHERGMIESKAQALDRMDRKDLRVTEIDADQPLDQVLLQIKALVWSLL